MFRAPSLPCKYMHALLAWLLLFLWNVPLFCQLLGPGSCLCEPLPVLGPQLVWNHEFAAVKLMEEQHLNALSPLTL